MEVSDYSEEENDKTKSFVRISEKSKTIYETAYKHFRRWCLDNSYLEVTEDALLQYFYELSKNKKSSTLWSKFSMLRKQVRLNDGIDLIKYRKLTSYLKKKNLDYKPKSSETFTKEQFESFLDNAPDIDHLASKVILIFGVVGSCRCEELKNITINCIQDLNNLILVSINDSVTKSSRPFTITSEKYCNLYRKYRALRPTRMESTRFFIKYQRGACFRNVMGIHTISRTCQKVAKFLKLPNVEGYTGHCLRRTSAAFSLLKRHGAWISSTNSKPNEQSSKFIGIKTYESFNISDTSVSNNEPTDVCEELEDDNYAGINLIKLIEYVRDNPSLYDINDRRYCEYETKELIWNEIGSRLGVKDFECKHAWELLKDNFRKFHKRSSVLPPRTVKWKYEDQMSFLLPYLTENNLSLVIPQSFSDSQCNNVRTVSPSNDFDDSITIKEECDEISSAYSEDQNRLDNHLREYNTFKNTLDYHETPMKRKRIESFEETSHDNDDLKQFFTGMMLTVKKFPIKDQAMVKAKIFKIVSDLEIEILNRPSQEQIILNESRITSQTESNSCEQPSTSNCVNDETIQDSHNFNKKYLQDVKVEFNPYTKRLN